MENLNKLFDEITQELTSEGQIFEVREYINKKGFKSREYASFPDSLKGYFDFGALHGEKDFLVYESERFTFNETITKAAQFANALISNGIKKGDRVAICMQNNPEFIFAYMGIVGIGAVCVPLNSWWVADEIKYAMNHCQAQLLLADKKRIHGLDDLDVQKIITSYTPDSDFMSFDQFIKDQPGEWPSIEIARDDHATIYYTSGSTGKPKGVLSSHRGVISSMFSWACISTILSEREKRLGNDDTPLASSESSILLCVPLFHATGSHVAFLMSILVGRKVVMMNKWDAGEAIKLIHEEKISDITGVPTQTWELLNHPDRDKYDLSSLKTLGGGGGPRPAKHVKLLDENFKGRPGIGYGLTETSPVTHLNPEPPGRVVPGSIGICIPNTECRIVDYETGKDLGTGKQGELWIRGPQVMRGYLNNQEATNQTIDPEGWLKTGDIAEVDEDGYFKIVDRVKELIKYKGFQVAPAELEALLLTHPSIADCAVVPAEDPEAGEIPVGFVVYKENMVENPETIMEFIAQKVSPQKKIRRIIQIEQIPKSPSGKILRRHLKDQIA